mgnify:CR=1 FL=1
MIFIHFERKASLYDTNLYSAFDCVLPYNLKIEKQDGKFHVRDCNGYSVISSESNFPIGVNPIVKYPKIYVSKVVLVSTFDGVLSVIVKSSKGEFFIVKILDYVSDGLISKYDRVEVKKGDIDLSKWIDLEIIPNYIRVWQLYALSATCFLSISFIISLSFLFLSRKASKG